MKTQNITLSLPQNTLQKLELLAARRNSSISRLLTEAIEGMLTEEAARHRQITLMKKGIDLEFQKPANRDVIHQR